MSIYLLFTIKRYIEQLMMSPFIILGHVIGWFRPKSDYDIFFFIPNYGVGGAEYVNAKILEVVQADKKVKLIFTRISYAKTALHLFEHPNVTIEDISKYSDNKYLYFMNILYRGILASEILKQKKRPLVFNGQCNFAYKLSPHLYRKCHIIELIHVFDTRFARVWMPFVSFLDTRIGIAYNVIDQINDYQRKIGVPEKYIRFEKLNLYVDMPDSYKKAVRQDGLLRVYYAGRNAPEKRVHLLYEIARRVSKEGLPIRFTFVGDLKHDAPADLEHIAAFPGMITAGADVYEFVRTNDVVLLTSRKEGLPIMILEAIKLGIVPVTTPEADIPVYINASNGYLLDDHSEETIVSSAVQALKELAADKELYLSKSAAAKETYQKNFGKKIFDDKIRELFATK